MFATEFLVIVFSAIIAGACLGVMAYDAVTDWMQARRNRRNRVSTGTWTTTDPSNDWFFKNFS